MACRFFVLEPYNSRFYEIIYPPSLGFFAEIARVRLPLIVPRDGSRKVDNWIVNGYQIKNLKSQTPCDGDMISDTLLLV